MHPESAVSHPVSNIFDDETISYLLAQLGEVSVPIGVSCALDIINFYSKELSLLWRNTFDLSRLGR